MSESVDGVENPAVRAAVEAFAAAPDQAGSIEVLRQCMHGHLLLDVTGSDLRMSADGANLEAGSTIRIATTQGPDGATALVAFTSQAEIARTRSATAQTQSMVQAGVDVLELVQSQDHQWLYVDPAGPTCALSRAEVDFALRVARNDAVRDALSVAAEDPNRRDVLIEALCADGALLVAVDAGETHTSTLPDGRPALLVFTSAPELLARAASASIVTLSTAEVLDMLRAGTYAGLVVNPAGPWAAVTAEELLARAAR